MMMVPRRSDYHKNWGLNLDFEPIVDVTHRLVAAEQDRLHLGNSRAAIFKTAADGTRICEGGIKRYIHALLPTLAT